MSLPAIAKRAVMAGASSVAMAAALSVGGAAFAADATATAAAAKDNTQLDEVVITANKRGAQALQSVGSSIGVIGAVQMEQRGITEFTDIVRNVAGLNVVDTGPGQKVFMMRGLVGAGESTVGLYYDDMPSTGSGESAAENAGRQTDLYIYDADHVEVLRGPQSTLYGSSALAGVVRIITKQPDRSGPSAELVVDGSTTEHGTGNTALKGYVNLPVIEDKLAVRLVGYSTHDGGFIDNPYLHTKHINGVENQGFRASAKAWLDPNTTVTGQLFVQDMHAHDQPISRPYGAVIGTTAWPAVGWLNNDSHTLQPRYDHTTMASLNLQHDFSKATLNITQSYFKRRNTDTADNSGLIDSLSADIASNNFPNVPLPANSVFTSGQVTTMWTSEGRVASKLDGPVNGVAGVLYSDRTILLDNQFQQTDATSGEIDRSAPSWYHRTANFHLTQLAAYGEVTWNVTSKLSLIGGARVFNDKRNDQGYSIVPFMRVLGRPGPSATVTSNETKAIFKGEGNYKLTDDVLLYASFSQGYRAGGTVVQVVPDMPNSYGPDYTNNFEVGAKTQWLDHRLQVNAAAYRINWYDTQISGSFFGGAFSGILNCTGLCAHSQGIEMDVTARPIHGLDLNLATTVFKAEWDKPQPAMDGDPQKGTQLQNTPNFTLSAAGNYTWDLPYGLTGAVHGDVSYNDGTPITNYVMQYNVHAPAYTLVNFSGDVAKGQRWDLKLYARNVFDKRAAVNVENNSVTPVFIVTNQPRTIGLQATLRY